MCHIAPGTWRCFWFSRNCVCQHVIKFSICKNTSLGLTSPACAFRFLAPQPGLDCCVPASPCVPALSHSTSLFVWPGGAPSPSPSIHLYALSDATPPVLMTPQPHSRVMRLPANAESISVVVSGGAPHSWKIHTGGDVLISGTYHSCPLRDSAANVVPCSALDAVAVLPLPVGLGRNGPITLHVSVEADYSGSGGLADFGVADDDEEEDAVHISADHTSQPAASAGLQFERVGKGPASALQVRLMHVGHMCRL
jgi:hypothetical protein